jgi:general secretion pathway protein D
MVQVNFEDVDIRTVLKTIGEITGINFIPHQSVSGMVTVMSPTPIRLGDIYPFLQSILDVHGYATVEADHVVKVVPKTEATKRNLQVRIGADPRAIPRNDAMATQILPLRYADAGEVSQIVQPLLSAGGLMATYPRTNAIMVTDTSANIHHIAQIIAQLDVEGSRENVVLFPLTHASAQVLSEQVVRILDESRTAAAPSGRARPAQIEGQGTKVLPDTRTNSLIVVGGEQSVETIRRLVAQLDVERPTGVDNVHVTYLKNADANDVAPSLEAALAGMRLTDTVDARQPIQVTADSSTNSLIVVASPQDFAMISQIVEKLDIVREQVLVEMTILEVSEEALKELGVDWATLDAAVSNSVRGFGLTNLGPRVNFLSGDLEGLAVGAWKDTSAGVQIGAILQALQKKSGVNILSTPHVLTSNHRKAKIVVGENTPFVVQSRVTETTDFLTPTVIKQYEYKDVGITLDITPHVSQSGLVRLEIDSEFTKLIDSVTAASSDTPTTAKRSAQTVVTMGSGATVVIGGLIRDDKTRVENRVPLIGDVPVVGNLFRWQRDRVQKTNLLIFITPHVMTSPEQLQQITDSKRDQMRPLLEERR